MDFGNSLKSMPLQVDPIEVPDERHIWAYHTIGKGEFIEYTADEIEDANLAGGSVIVDATGLCTITNPSLVAFKTIPIYFPEEVPERYRTRQNLRLVAVSADAFPVYHYYILDSRPYRPRKPKRVAVSVESNANIRNRNYGSNRRLISRSISPEEDSTNGKGERKLLHQPFIGPQDSAWKATENYFAQALQSLQKDKSHRALLKLIDLEFTESQRQLIFLADKTPSNRLTIQMQNSRLYKQALKDKFEGTLDNTVTKMTMLRFGLPISPLTKKNTLNSGTNEDGPESEEDEIEAEWEKQKKVVPTVAVPQGRVTAPLSFLDYYNARDYGYSSVRTSSRHNFNEEEMLPSRISADLNEEQRTNHEDHNFNLPVGGSRSAFQFSTSLRGGAGEPSSTEPLIYTPVGRFHLDVEFESEDHPYPVRTALINLARRIFRMSKVVGLAVDIFDGETYKHTSIVLSKAGTSPLMSPNALKQAEKWLSSQIYGSAGDDGTNQENLRLRMRPQNAGQGSDPLIPHQNIPGVVEIEDSGTQDIAYWYTPLSDTGVEITGINKQNESLVNAMECLFQEHYSHTFRYKLNGGEKSKAYNGWFSHSEFAAIRQAAIEKKDSQSSLLTFTLREEDLNKPLPSIVFPPIFGRPLSMTFPTDPFMVKNSQKSFFEQLRSIVTERFSTTPNKFSHFEIYRNLSELMTSNGTLIAVDGTKDKVFDKKLWESGILDDPENLGETIPCLFVRPQFADITIEDLNAKPEENPMQLTIADLQTLGAFRNAVGSIWKSWDPGMESFVLQNPQSGGPETETNVFLIDPEMTEEKWKLQVYWMLWSSELQIEFIGITEPLKYVTESIVGPLWSTRSAEIVKPLRVKWTRVSDPEEILNLNVPNETIASAEKIIKPGATPQAPSEPDWRPRQNLESNQTAVPRGRSTVRPDTGSLERNEQTTAGARRRAYSENTKITGPDGAERFLPSSLHGSYIQGGDTIAKSITTTLTQKETDAMRERVRSLQVALLERSTTCQICEKSYPAGPEGTDQLKAHLGAHVRQSVSNVCPCCEEESPHIDWRNATHATRLAHLFEIHGFGVLVQTNLPYSADVEGSQSLEQTVESGEENRSAAADDEEEYSPMESDSEIAQSTGVRNEEQAFEPLCNYPLPDERNCDYSLYNQELNSIESHFRQHLPQRCPLPNCNHIFGDDEEGEEAVGHDDNTKDNLEKYLDHLRTHIPKSQPPIPDYTACDFPGCPHRYSPAASDETYVVHSRTHMPEFSERAVCNFPGCGHRFAADASSADITLHITSAHAEVVRPVAPIAPPPVQAPVSAEPEVDPEDIIPADADPVLVPQKYMDQADQTGKFLACPHCLNRTIRTYDMKKRKVDQPHLQIDHPRVKLHTEWLFLNKQEQNVAKAGRQKQKKTAKRARIPDTPAREEQTAAESSIETRSANKKRKLTEKAPPKGKSKEGTENSASTASTTKKRAASAGPTKRPAVTTGSKKTLPAST